MKVVSYCKEHKGFVRCSFCEAVLEFSKEDLNNHCIRCPICGFDVRVNDEEYNHVFRERRIK